MIELAKKFLEFIVNESYATVTCGKCSNRLINGTMTLSNTEYPFLHRDKNAIPH